MENGDEAKKAITELNGATFENRDIVVNEAKPRKTTSGRY
jgi:RNA recognition motif-containing protein